MSLDTFQLLFTLLVLLAVIYLFVRESIPAYLTAVLAMTVLLLVGAIDTHQLLAVFSNPAPITIACMFVMTAALERTGVLDALGQVAVRSAVRRRRLTIVAMLLGVILVSAFVNNTPLVMVMAPVVITVAKRLKEYPSRFLLPLCFAATLGGTCSLVGTSTNLMVDGVAQSLGQPAFTMFEITIPGLILAGIGAAFLLLFGRALLPERNASDAEEKAPDTRRYTAEAAIRPGSVAVGHSLNEMGFDAVEDCDIVDLVRLEDADTSQSGLVSRVRVALEEPGNRESRIRSALRDIPLQAGDRVLFRVSREQLPALKELPGLDFLTEEVIGAGTQAESASARTPVIAEGVVAANSAVIGRKPADLRFRRRFGCQVLAIYRANQSLTGPLDQVALRQGDVILCEGPLDELAKLFEHEGVLSLGQARRHGFDRRRAPIAVAALVAVIVLSALGVMPIAGLAFAGTMLVVVTGCISPERAYAAIHWRILLLIFGMLGLTAAMEGTGAAHLIVEHTAHALKPFGAMAVLAMVYALASLLTEFMSNNAVALLLSALVIGLAESLGADARPFLVAVIFGASASFATPVGYQVNAFVYAVGNYRFTDFLKIGIPLKLLMFLATMLVIPAFWEF